MGGQGNFTQGNFHVTQIVEFVIFLYVLTMNFDIYNFINSPRTGRGPRSRTWNILLVYQNYRQQGDSVTDLAEMSSS